MSARCLTSLESRFYVLPRTASQGGDLKSAHVMSVFSFKHNFNLAQKHHNLAIGRLLSATPVSSFSVQS